MPSIAGVQGAQGEAFAPFSEQALAKLGQGEVWGPLEGAEEQVRLRCEAMGAPVPAAGLSLGAPGALRGLQPAPGTGRTDSEALGGGRARQAAFDRPDDTDAEVGGEGYCHRWSSPIVRALASEGETPWSLSPCNSIRNCSSLLKWSDENKPDITA